MTMLADRIEVVIGVDTHNHPHPAAVMTAASRAVVAQATVAATRPAPANCWPWPQQPGRRGWASEGTGGYGAGRTRFLAAHQEQVVTSAAVWRSPINPCSAIGG